MIANNPDKYEPLELGTPPEFEGVPRRPMVTPGNASFFCPCCPYQFTAPMYSELAEREPIGALVVFRCLRCNAVLKTRKVPGNVKRTPFGL